MTATDDEAGPGEFGATVRTRSGARLVARPVAADTWVICENAIGAIDRRSVHGFVRRLGTVWEVAATRAPLVRHYCAERTDVMRELLHDPVMLPPLPLLPVAVDRDVRHTDDQLGVEEVA